MTTLGDVINECLQALQGYGLQQPRTAFLAADVTASGLTFTVDDASQFYQGVAEVEDEVVFIQSVDTTANTLTIAPDGRGWFGTTPAAHVTNTRVTMAPVWPRNRVANAINDTIIGTWPTLFGVATTSFVANSVVNTYELPQDCEKVLKVSASTPGPSMDQQPISRFSFSSVAPEGVFTSGNTVTIQEPVFPGATVTVTYMKAPSPLAAGTDDFTNSGLRETAKLAVVYGACAELLSYMDASRLPVDAASSDPAERGNEVGSAARIAAQLTARHQMELERERRRLRETTPVAVNVRIR